MSIPSIITTTLAALDNQRSLTPLLVKDLINSGGRSFMEYKRGGVGANYAGRERLFEELATTAVWIFGRKFIHKRIFSPVMTKVFKLDPDIDVRLLMKNPLQKVPAWITESRIPYIRANWINFILGTIIPVAIIGWLIPTINQAITRKLVAKDKAKSQPQDRIQPKANPMQPVPNTAYAPSIPWSMQSGIQSGMQTQMQYNPFSMNTYGNNAYAYPMQTYPYPMVPYSTNYWQRGYRPWFTRFSGIESLGDKMFELVNDAVYGNIIIDGGISGGRLLKARNIPDFAETAVRESSIILFLYFAGDFIKGLLRNTFDKHFHAISKFDYSALQWIKKQKITPAKLLSDFYALPEGFDFGFIDNQLNHATGTFENNFLELARQHGFIKILSKENTSAAFAEKIWGAERWASKEFQHILDPRQFVDIEGIIKTFMGIEAAPGAKAVPGLIKQFEEAFAHFSGTESEALKSILTRTSWCKGTALLASYVVSTVCISILAPMLQHWITYKLSGKKDFPGIQNTPISTGN